MADKPNIQPLWDWGLHHYALPDAAEKLLIAQDEFTINVNIILWSCWCADHGHTISNLELRTALTATERWVGEVTNHIRSARRALKSPQFRDHAMGDQDLYERLKEIELECEKTELAFYERIVEQGNLNQNGENIRFSIARKNIAAYVAMAGLAHQEGFSVSLIDELVTLLLQDSQE